MVLQSHHFDLWTRLFESKSFFAFTVNSVSQCFPRDRKTWLRCLAREYRFQLRPLQVLSSRTFIPDCCLEPSSALITHSGLSTKQHSRPHFGDCDGQGTFCVLQLQQERGYHTCSASGRIGMESKCEGCDGQGERNGVCILCWGSGRSTGWAMLKPSPGISSRDETTRLGACKAAQWLATGLSQHLVS